MNSNQDGSGLRSGRPPFAVSPEVARLLHLRTDEELEASMVESLGSMFESVRSGTANQ